MKTRTKRAALLSLLLGLALCVGAALPGLSAAEPAAPVPASSVWNFTGGSDVVFDEAGQSRTLNAYTAQGDQLFPASFVDDARYGRVPAPGTCANNKWGDQSCPWYLDVNEVQTTLSLWVNFPAASLSADTGAVAGVLFSDLITNFEGGRTDFSWALWVLDNGDLAFSTFDYETQVWGGGWTFGNLTGDAWHQVTLGFDVKYGKLYVYLDGVVQGPSLGDGNGVSVYLAAGTKVMKEVSDRDKADGTVKYRGFQIGQDGARGRATFPGKFAQAKLYYNRVLTADEVAAAYAAEKDPEAPTALALAAGYDFTEADYTRNHGREIQIIDDRSGAKNYLISNPNTKWESDETYEHVRQAKSWAYNLETPVDFSQGFTIALTANAKNLDANTFLLTNLIPTVNVATQENSYTKSFDLHVNTEGRVGFEINDGAGGMWYSVTGPSPSDLLPTNRWVHLIVTYDPETDVVRSYVDGVLKNLAVLDIAGSWKTPDPESGLCVGVNAAQLVGLTNYTQAFNGRIANVRLYEHAVNNAAAAAIYAGEDGARETAVSYETAESLPDEHLTGAYNMDEGAGEILHDLSAAPKSFVLGTGTSWMQNLTEGKDCDYVVAPGYAVSNKAFDLSQKFTLTSYLSISSAHNGFGIVISGKSESRPHDLGYLDKDFYIESNPAIWNVQINSIGRLCFEDQGAWDLNLIEVPYKAVPELGDYWMHFAMTVEQETANKYVFKFYFDGQLVHVAYKTKGVSAPQAEDQTVVFANQTASNNLQGYACEFRMFDTVLTAAEVRRQMAGDGLETPADLTEGALVKAKDFTPKAQYEKGERITVNLAEYFANKTGEAVSYTATDESGAAVGAVVDGVFSWTPDREGEYKITVTAMAGLQSARFDCKVKVVAKSAGEDGNKTRGGCKGAADAAATGAALLLLAAAGLVLARRRRRG